MSGADVEVVQQFYEEFNRRGVAAVYDYYHPEIEWHDIAELPDARVHHGLEAGARALQRYVDLGGEIEVHVEEIRDLGGEVLVTWRYEGVGVGSGVPVDALFFHIWALRDGKLARLRQFLDNQAALDAAGLSE